MSNIHQFVAGFTHGDAISNEALYFRKLFREWGHKSDIYSELDCILPSLRSEAFDYRLYEANQNPEDIVLLHLASGSVVNTAFKDLKCRKAIIYHNITPPHFFEMINKRTARLLEEGLEQAASLANAAELNMAVSQYDADGLTAMGYRDVKVLPLLIDFDRFSQEPDSATLGKYCDGKKNILFVGRGVPNKKLEDLLTFFHYYQKNVEPNSRLIHIGSFGGAEPYYASLKRMARNLRILKDVEFMGAVPFDQLIASYRAADLFVTMSEHEGFCIPLLESMHFDVPVLAYAAAAIPETLADSGVLFKEKDYKQVSELAGRITSDTDFRNAILSKQSARLQQYNSRNLEKELKQHIGGIKSLTHSGVRP